MANDTVTLMYFVDHDKFEGFIKFCKIGAPTKNGDDFERDGNGNPETGVVAWLTGQLSDQNDRENVHFYASQEPPASAQPAPRSDPRNFKAIVVICPKDPNISDWGVINGFMDRLSSATLDLQRKGWVLQPLTDIDDLLVQNGHAFDAALSDNRISEQKKAELKRALVGEKGTNLIQVKNEIQDNFPPISFPV
jgi:hypothetical protein